MALFNKTLLLLTTNFSSSINSGTPVAVTWPTEIDLGTHTDTAEETWFEIPDANQSRITFKQSGLFQLSVSLPFAGGVARACPRVRLRLNGSTYIEGISQTGYIRNATGHTESSVQISRPLNVVADDYIEVMMDGVSTAQGTVTLVSGQSLLEVHRL